MSRFIAFAAVAALIAGCSDAPVAPRSVHATGASFDGTPPPPPVTGFGEGTFFAGLGGEGLAATQTFCPPVETITQYEFVYSTDAATEPFGMNQVAHIKFDADLSHQITIHQKPNEAPVVDAEGMIVGPGFSFRIMSSAPTGGFLTPGGFQIFVTGVLKTPGGSCETSAEFDGTLIPEPDSD